MILNKQVKLTYIIALYIFCFVACSRKEEAKNSLLLTYEQEIEILDETKTESVKNYLLQKYGDSVGVIYDSRGNIRMNYYGSGEMGMEYNFYNAGKGINCAKWKNMDSIFYYDASVNEYQLDSTSRIETRNGFILTYYSQNPADSNGIIQESHFIHDSLKIDPYLYKNFKDFSFYEILAEAELLPIKTILTAEGIRISRNLVRSKNITEPRESYFDLDTEIPSRKY